MKKPCSLPTGDRTCFADMSTCTTRPVTEIDAQSDEAARDAATRDEFARIAAQRIFVGPRGGLVVAWRRERPASVRLPSEADVEALRFCVDIDCESELPVLSAGLVAGVVLSLAIFSGCR